MTSLVFLGLLMVVMLAVLPLTGQRFDEQKLALNRQAPNGAHWCGYDALGRDLLVRCLFGGVISFSVGVGAALISVTVGVLWGAISALAGGRVDNAMMRLVDILYGLPYILLVILMKVAFERPLTVLIGDKQVANVAILFVAIGSVDRKSVV
jgi:dipeptide transport system permease protein